MKRNQPGDCSCCPSRYFCKELCVAAELYANRDHVKQKEETIGFPNIQAIPEIDLVFTELTKTESKILTLLGSGLTRLEVSEKLEITRHSLRTHIYNIRKKHLKN